MGQSAQSCMYMFKVKKKLQIYYIHVKKKCLKCTYTSESNTILLINFQM